MANSEASTLLDAKQNNKNTFFSKLKSKYNTLVNNVFPTGFCASTRCILSIALQQIITNSTIFTIIGGSIIICGHLKDREKLDAVSFANGVITTFGIMTGEGMASACDTFFSQVYGSKTRKTRMGVILQRSLIIISLFALILWPIFLNMEPIFILMHQNHLVAKLAADYMTYFTPGLLFAFQFIVINKYLQNQNKFSASMISVVVGNIFNLTSQYITVHIYHLGIRASAICQAFSFLIMELTLIFYILISRVYVKTWDGWKKEAFVDWKPFLLLAIPGAGSLLLDCLNFEIAAIVSGILGNTDLGIHTVLFQVQNSVNIISVGIGFCVCVRVGQALGANNPKQAVTHFRTGFSLSFILLSIFAVFNFCMRKEIPKIISDDKRIINGSSDIFGILAFLNVLESLNYILVCTLLGCGRQHIYLLFIVCCFYFVGQPIGICLAFLTPLRVAGVWLGLLISLALHDVTLFTFINFQNWEKLASDAQKRIALKMEYEETSDEIEDKSSADDTKISSFNEMLSKHYSPNDTKFIKALLEKACVFVLLCVLLVCGIFLHIYLPRSAFVKSSTSHNSTQFTATRY